MFVPLLMSIFYVCISSGDGWALDREAQHELYMGIRKCNPSKVQKAIEKGADVNKSDENGHVPLGSLLSATDSKLCSEKTGIEIATLLLKAGADVNKHDKRELKYTPLMYLAARGVDRAVWKVSRDGGMVQGYFATGKAQSKEEQNYPYGTQMAKLLLGWGANPNLINKELYNAIMLAASNGNKEVAYACRRSPTDFDRALHTSAYLTDSKAVENLLAWGASPKAKFNVMDWRSFSESEGEDIQSLLPLTFGFEPFSCRLSYGDFKEGTSALETVGSDLSTNVRWSKTGMEGILSRKLIQKQIDTAKALLRRDPSLKQDGYVAVCSALANSQIDYVKFLLTEMGPIIKQFNGFDKTGKHSLWTCIDVYESSSNEFFESLGNLGLNINARGAKGRTPLMMAVDLSGAEFIAPLLYMKADKNLKDDDGKTAYDLYLENGGKDPEVKSYLRPANYQESATHSGQRRTNRTGKNSRARARR